ARRAGGAPARTVHEHRRVDAERRTGVPRPARRVHARDGHGRVRRRRRTRPGGGARRPERAACGGAAGGVPPERSVPCRRGLALGGVARCDRTLGGERGTAGEPGTARVGRRAPVTVTRSMVGAPAGEVDVVPSRSAGHHDDVPLASTYYRAIDGLRGVAVLSVVVYHTGLYEAGLFGVDVFMVLSGFLITLTLLRERSRRGRIGLGAFYRRRAKRLIVPLLVVLGASALAVAQLGRATDADVFARQGLASLLYVANWEQILRGDAYWDTTGGVPGPLAHMWSLSITEQFYLVWPPLLVLILLLVPARRRVPVVGTLAGALAVVTGFAAALLYDGTN